jgi:uncharacterized protein (TIGR03067 family)
MERRVALKVINRNLIDQPAAVERFRREVKTAAKLAHPNIVTAFDAEQAGDTHFLVMEYVEGTSLARVVAEEGRLPVARACDYVRQAALGLQHAYEQGMVHRDIKPHNLMLTPAGQVKVLDFGLARFAQESQPAAAPPLPEAAAADAPSAGTLTHEGTVMGTPDYIAPEQVRDAHAADIRADIYSLGCTLYDLLAGHAPFPDGTALQKVMAHVEKKPRPLTELRKDVPAGLARVVARMLAKEPAQRYQTPAEVAAALQPFAGGKPARRRRLLLAGQVLGMLALLAALVALTYAVATRPWERGTALNTRTDDRERLQGTWKAVAVEWDGEPRPPETVRQADYTFVFAGDKAHLKRNARPGRPALDVEMSYYLDSTKDPKQIDYMLMTDQRNAWFGIYRFEGDFLRICGQLDPTDRVERPTGFVTRPGSQHAMLLLQRVPAGGAPRSDKELIQGRWQAVAIQTYRRPAPAARLKPFSNVVFAGDRLYQFTGEQCIFKLDPSKSPKEIDLLDNDTWVRRGIYSLDGDTLKLCLGGPRVPRPTEFLTDADGGLIFLELRRQPGPAEPPPPPPDDSIRQFPGHESPVKAVAFSPDGRYALSGSGFPEGRDRTLRLWDVASGKELRRYGLHSGVVQSVAFSPDGRYVVSGSGDQAIRLFDRESGEEVKRLPTPGQNIVNSVAFSRDGQHLLSGGGGQSTDDLVRLWDVVSGKEVLRFKGHKGFVTAVALSPDGLRALTGSADRTARVWDVTTGREVWCLKAHAVPLVEGVAFAPNSRYAATCGWDFYVHLWDLQTGRPVRDLSGHEGCVRSVAFSPDGTRLLTGSDDRTVRLWEVATGRELCRLQGHTAAVWSVAFSPDGRQALSGSADRTLRLWQLPGDWVPLFNGKDLAGWKPLRSGTASNWRVANGVLTGAGPVSPTHLMTERGEYENFHVRAEVRINDGGNSGLYFRATGPQPAGYPAGYEAQINSTHNDPVRTGSLYGFGPRATVTEMLVKPEEWFTLEVHADGNHIVIQVNGRTTVDFLDEGHTYRRGQFGLQQFDRRTVVQFRKIEVLELPRK